MIALVEYEDIGVLCASNLASIFELVDFVAGCVRDRQVGLGGVSCGNASRTLPFVMEGLVVDCKGGLALLFVPRGR